MADEFDDKELKSTLSAWRESAEKHSDRPDWFWARQRALISSRMQEPQPRRWPALAWAGVAATIAIGVALILPEVKPQHPNGTSVVKPVTVEQAKSVSDSDLMQQLEETMNSGVPEALQPASTLQQAMETAYSGPAATKTKENMQ